ncbi:MAG: 3-oxoacyl-[acyl-carrier-protein] reductase [Terriglobales bacterium]
MKFEGRVALVTGASQGIGHACALALAREGASVAVAARSQQKLDELVAQIAAKGGKAAAFVIDVAEEEQVKSGIKSILAQFGKIDILVNNAGITRDQLVMRMKRADWDTVLNTNLTSAYLCIQQAIGSMLKQRWGRIINITSVFGQTGQAGQANYAASKAGLIGLTMAMAREVASRNITCNAVAPGFIETSMTSVLSEEFKQNAVKQIPLGRVGSPEDIANAVCFLASEEASYITGHVLNVNGGMLMG